MNKTLLATALSILLWLAVWQAIWWFRLVSPAVLASPAEVWGALPEFFSRTGMLPDIQQTFTRSLWAFLASVPVGIGMGYAVFALGPFRFPIESGLDFVRSIPATALVPVFLIVFGVGDSSKIAVGIFSSSLVICLSALLGLKQRNETRMASLRLLKASAIQQFLFFNLPESLGQIFLGLRAGASLALVLVVVSEMFIGSNQGLGKAINDLRSSDRIPLLYCALLMTGVIGYAYNWILIFLEKRILHWRGR